MYRRLCTNTFNVIIKKPWYSHRPQQDSNPLYLQTRNQPHYKCMSYSGFLCFYGSAIHCLRSLYVRNNVTCNRNILFWSAINMHRKLFIYSAFPVCLQFNGRRTYLSFRMFHDCNAWLLASFRWAKITFAWRLLAVHDHSGYKRRNNLPLAMTYSP